MSSGTVALQFLGEGPRAVQAQQRGILGNPASRDHPTVRHSPRCLERGETCELGDTEPPTLPQTTPSFIGTQTIQD